MTRAALLIARISLLVVPVVALLTGQSPDPNTPPPYIEQIGIPVLMHDGIHLATDVYVPRGGGRWPAVLVRTPYNRRNAIVYRYFVRRGYVVVIQDVRGRN